MNDRAVIELKVDVSNPGQFFACCGLLELAELVWGEALLCRFNGDTFCVLRADEAPDTRSLDQLLTRISMLPLVALEPADEMATPLGLNGLRLDWWKDSRSGGRSLKTWAGSQSGPRIAQAMQQALPRTETQACLSFSCVVFDQANPIKKVEPYYFDARRGGRPFARDIGFSPDALGMTTPAYPAVEFLCLVGLQRCRPAQTERPRVFDYFTWRTALPTSVLPGAVCGLLPAVGARGYRFENAFRTDQRKHKAFSPARQLEENSHE